MNTEMPVGSFAAIATVIAALISASISFINLTLTKELKTSEFRQAWIDGLRDELAQFLGAARAFARAVETVHRFGPNYKEQTALLISDEKFGELRYQAAETFSKIQLRLNPDEPEHIELLRLLRRALEEQNAMLANRTGIDETLKAIERANEYAQPVLKKNGTELKTENSHFA